MSEYTLQHTSQHHPEHQQTREGWGVQSPERGAAPWGFGFLAYLLRGDRA